MRFLSVAWLSLEITRSIKCTLLVLHYIPRGNIPNFFLLWNSDSYYIILAYCKGWFAKLGFENCCIESDSFGQFIELWSFFVNNYLLEEISQPLIAYHLILLIVLINMLHVSLSLCYSILCSISPSLTSTIFTSFHFTYFGVRTKIS